MSVATFIPEVWSAKLQLALEKALVFGQPSVVNRDYEGEISQAGDTVHINSFGDPTVSTYTGTVTYEDLTTAETILLIDQKKYWAFNVDDVDKVQAKGALSTEPMRRAGYKLKDDVDIYIEALFAGAPSANQVNSGSAVAVAAGDPTSAYDDILVPLSVKLDEANVPTEGRFAIAPPWFFGRLISDDRFMRADAAGGNMGGVHGNGFVGSAAGFTLYKSNNCSLVTGDDYRVSAGINGAITYADQLVETEALRREATFGDGVRGLHVYGAKLVRPEMIATALASQT